jgi:peroxiredoxin
MENIMKAVLTMLCLAALAGTLIAKDVEPGRPAPDFTLRDVDGKTVSLSDFKGKLVVLEWTNPDCPFVKKHYDTGNMQALQKTYTNKGVIWLSICSSAEGKQGFFSPEKWKDILKDQKSAATALLLDPDGKVGRLYVAKTTPHMYVIGADGILLYAGAIDDKPSTKKEDVADAKNFITLALDAALAGKPIETTATAPYGCSVKY